MQGKNVEQEGNDAGGEFCQHIADAVEARTQQNGPLKMRTAEAQMTVPQKIDKTDQRADRNGENRPQSGSECPQRKDTNQDIIQQKIQEQPGHGHDQPDTGISVGTHHVLKEKLKGHGGGSAKRYGRIGQNMGHQAFCTAQQCDKGPQE